MIIDNLHKDIRENIHKHIKLHTYESMMDGNEEFISIYNKCKHYTMTTKERMFSLYKSIKYIIQSGIEGDFVECGVWRGGSAMVIGYTLVELDICDRAIYLYDTYSGMTKPTDRDSVGGSNFFALEQWQKYNKGSYNNWCFVKIEDVKNNLYLTGYPNIKFIKGRVEDTIPQIVPEKIALLRLDTDWYESTKHELNHLFPLLSSNGVLIIDDYGCWDGSKQAVDEYFINKPVLINRVDESCVIILNNIGDKL